MEKMILDMSVGGHKAGNLVIGAASVSVTLPVGIECLALSTAANCHFRITNGASTAVATDPLITASSQIQTFKLPSNIVWTLSAIQDGASAGNLNYFPVFEG